MYQATEDASGAQLALLARLGAAVLAPFQAQEGGDEAAGQPPPEGACARPGEGTRAAAAARAADALMALEHRALQARLDALWRALWACCAPDQAGGAGARAAGGPPSA